MKKLILILITCGCSALIRPMEEKLDKNKIADENKGYIFSQLDPELQKYTIDAEIQSELNSSSNIATNIIKAINYISNVTKVNKYWLSKRAELLSKLKEWAKEKFSSSYISLPKEKLNQKLEEDVINYRKIWDYKYKNQTDSDLLALADYRNDIVKLILAGADVNHPIPINPYVPIYLLDFAIDYVNDIRANYLNDIDFIRFLIVFKANPNTQNDMGETPLIKLLYNFESHPNLTDDDFRKIKEIVELLIAGGADLNLQDASGQTALIFAVRNKPQLVQLLIEHGAKTDIKDRADKTALDYAIEKGDENIIKLLTTKAEGGLK